MVPSHQNTITETMRNLYDEEILLRNIKEINDDKLLVLVIYDISDNIRRARFFKFLQGYGFSVQKSAFEARISNKQYLKLLSEIEKKINAEDNIRIYKLRGYGEVHTFGSGRVTNEEIIII